MTAKDARQIPAIGFLTVCEFPDQGFFGGYLVVNALGRPLEFHCTAPVKPNRAQEILYGTTLRPYVFGEQIGQTLVRKGRLEPVFVCTDCPPMLAVRDFIDPPALLVLDDEQSPDDSQLVEFSLKKCPVAVRSAWATDRETIQRIWQSLNATLDLQEPFGRIRGAIEEARKSAA